MLQRFRELVRRKEALEGEIEKISGVVKGGVCEGFEGVSASGGRDMPKEEGEGEEDEE